jgi:hypothetical protein
MAHINRSSMHGGEKAATKTPRHKAKPLENLHLCVFESWWRILQRINFNKTY